MKLILLIGMARYGNALMTTFLEFQRISTWRPGNQRTLEGVLEYLSSRERLPELMDESLRMGVYKLTLKMSELTVLRDKKIVIIL